MPNWLNEFLIAIGGGATATVGIAVISKSIIGKIVDTAVEKSTIKLANKLERTTKAYEILLRKEFEYYEKVDPHMATLVPLVQDLEYYAKKSLEDNSDENKEAYRAKMVQYLKTAPQLKSELVMFQPYIKDNIFDAVIALITTMQDNAQYLGCVAETVFGKNDDDFDEQKMKDIVNQTLERIGLVEIRIKDRLMELTEIN